MLNFNELIYYRDENGNKVPPSTQFDNLKFEDVFDIIEDVEDVVPTNLYFTIFTSGDSIGYTYPKTGDDCNKGSETPFCILRIKDRYKKLENDWDSLNMISFCLSMSLNNKYQNYSRINWNVIKNDFLPELGFVPEL